MANRSMAPKVERAKTQRVDAGKAEYTKAAYTMAHKTTDSEALTAAIAGRVGTVEVQGRAIRRIGMASRSETQTVTVGKETLSRVVTVEKAQTMRQYLRGMF